MNRPRWWWSRARRREWEAQRAQPRWPQRFHHEQAGWSSTFGEYRIASFDDGATWWNLGRDGSEVTPADPTLVAHLAGLDRLVAHVREHGPIPLCRPMTPAEAQALRDAGFTTAP